MVLGRGLRSKVMSIYLSACSLFSILSLYKLISLLLSMYRKCNKMEFKKCANIGFLQIQSYIDFCLKLVSHATTKL